MKPNCQNIGHYLKKFYFGRYRNLGGKYHLIFPLVIYFASMPLAFDASDTYNNRAITLLPIFPLLIYFYIRSMWSYPKTSMMLKADGADTWSIHMAPLVSVIPCLFSSQPDNFIMKGTRVILRECRTQGLTGKVILRSHLLGKKRTRDEIAQQLQKKFSQYTFTASEHTTKLGAFHAWSLSKARNARLKKRGYEVKRNFKKDRPVGVITITC